MCNLYYDCVVGNHSWKTHVQVLLILEISLAFINKCAHAFLLIMLFKQKYKKIFLVHTARYTKLVLKNTSTCPTTTQNNSCRRITKQKLGRM